MNGALLVHRLQFAFTATYHYLFPQLTMGLAPLIVILKTLALKTKDERYDAAAAHGDGFCLRERGVHGDDLAVSQDQVGGLGQGGRQRKAECQGGAKHKRDFTAHGCQDISPRTAGATATLLRTRH